MNVVLAFWLIVLGGLMGWVSVRAVRHVCRTGPARRRSRDIYRDACRLAWLNGAVVELDALAISQQVHGMPVSAQVVAQLASLHRQEVDELRTVLAVTAVDSPGTEGDAAEYARARALATPPSEQAPNSC